MAHQVPWDKIILEEYIRLAALDPLEEQIIRTRVASWSRQKQSEAFNISIPTLDRIIKRLKCKYDHVQMYSPLLPPRQSKDIFKEETDEERNNTNNCGQS